LNTEYNALLQMYGEKTEETEELRMDLQDVKEMYKLQVTFFFFHIKSFKVQFIIFDGYDHFITKYFKA